MIPTDQTIENLTPDSHLLHQLDGQWQRVAMLLLWKLAKREMVRITVAEIAAFSAEFAPGAPTLYTHGHVDALDFQVIDEASARRLAAHHNGMRGTA